MGYPPFNLTTLQLVAPTANMTKAEYKDAYGIDLDDANIKAFKLVLFGGEKYAIDKIEAVEGGHEIYFNGRILSITDIVQVSDEVYSVSNATPLYWHGLQIYNGVTKTTLLYAHIINQSETPIDSLAKLVSWLYSIPDLVYLECSGFFILEGVMYDVYSIYKSSFDVSPRLNAIVRKQGETTYSILSDINIGSLVDTYSDAVNKLN